MGLIIGIVGAGADKFTDVGMLVAKVKIKRILLNEYDIFPNILVSGHSPMGGIDIWSEEIADNLHINKDIKAPISQSWNGNYGYKQRNIDIANASKRLFNIVVSDYPSTYTGRKFVDPYHDNAPYCYHCNTTTHVKSGGCWTAIQFEKMHLTEANWVIVKQ